MSHIPVVPHFSPASVLSRGSRRHLAASLLLDVEALSPDRTNGEIFDLFAQRPTVISLPVTEENRPIGLINRNIFMDSMARPFYRELYGNKSCIAFMDKQPLIVDHLTSLQELSFKVVESGSKTLNDGFILTEEGRYLGVGTGRDLVLAITEMQAEKNRLVMESIEYAKVIQQSFLRPSRETLSKVFPDHLLIWEPRDLVGGDYFYCRQFDDGVFIGLFDCTGHGVPGAFMTLIMASLIESSLTDTNRQNPATVLAEVNRRVKSALGQIDHSHSERSDENVSEHGSDDGMDAAFCWIEPSTSRIVFAGAHMPLIVLEPGREIRLIEGDRWSVGYALTPMDQTWTNHDLTLPAHTVVYLTTDGLVDQPGGQKRIAFGKKRLCNLLAEHCDVPMASLRNVLTQALGDYQHDDARRDDVSLMGFRI